MIQSIHPRDLSEWFTKRFFNAIQKVLAATDNRDRSIRNVAAIYRRDLGKNQEHVEKENELDCHPSGARVDKAADCTALKAFRTWSLRYLLNSCHEKILLNVRDSFMDRFNLHKTIIKVCMHIASKLSVVIQRLSHLWLYKEIISC
jgi:hypothetical protein